MKFFIPHTNGPEQEKTIYDAIRSSARERTGWDIHNEKVYKLEYTHEGINYIAEVGQREKRQGEEVIAILSSTTYLICTPSRGVGRGGPIIVGRDEVTHVEKFE